MEVCLLLCLRTTNYRATLGHCDVQLSVVSLGHYILRRFGSILQRTSPSRKGNQILKRHSKLKSTLHCLPIYICSYSAVTQTQEKTVSFEYEENGVTEFLFLLHLFTLHSYNDFLAFPSKMKKRNVILIS